MQTINPTQNFSIGQILPKKNVSTAERLIMIAGGAFILYKTLSKKESSTTKNTIGGAMLLRGISGYCPAYHVMDAIEDKSGTNVNIRVTSIINKPILQVYAFWRNLENLPKFMNHLDTVTSISDNVSEWTLKGPLGIGKLSWKATVIKEEKNKLLSWKSLPGSEIENVGKVIFKPKGQATEIDVTISYHAPLGKIGENAAKLVNPFFKKMVKDDIENLKAYLESGYDV